MFLNVLIPSWLTVIAPISRLYISGKVQMVLTDYRDCMGVFSYQIVRRYHLY